MTFPLRSLIEVGGRPMLGGLKLLLSSFRLHNDAPERRLPALLKASRDAQAEVSTRLAAQVLGALHELLRGLHAADRERIETLAARRAGASLRRPARRPAAARLPALRRGSRPHPFADGRRRARLLRSGLWRTCALRAVARRSRASSRHDGRAARRLGAIARAVSRCFTMATARETGSAAAAAGCSIRRRIPFLQGQDKADDPPAPAAVSDGCMLRILDLLITVDGEKLSYRTLDVEQIGSVYETVMGFTVETRAGPAVAIKAGKNDRTPVFVDLAALAAAKGTERAEVPQGGGRPHNCSPTRSLRRLRRRRSPRRRLRLCGRLSTSAARRAATCRRPERRCCSRQTSAVAPVAITRRAR